MIRFGLLADVQYSEMDNGNTEGRVQRFREAPGKLRLAVADYALQDPPLDFVLSVGDLINGNNLHPVMLTLLAAPTSGQHLLSGLSSALKGKRIQHAGLHRTGAALHS